MPTMVTWSIFLIKNPNPTVRSSIKMIFGMYCIKSGIIKVTQVGTDGKESIVSGGGSVERGGIMGNSSSDGGGGGGTGILLSCIVFVLILRNWVSG